MTALHKQKIAAHEEVGRLRATLADIIDSLPSMIAVVDRDGGVEIWNEKAWLFTGVPASAAHGMTAEALLPQFGRYLRQIPGVIDQKHPCSFDRIQVFTGLVSRFYSMQLVPLASGDVGRAVVRIDETTEQVRIEEVMMQTEKMMMVGSLAAGMAHEINNPLGAIMQHAQNIERRVSPDIPANLAAARKLGISLDQVRSYLEERGIIDFIGHIRTGGARAAAIIDNLLKFSRRNVSTFEETSLAELINQTLELAGNDYDLKKRYDFRHIEIIRDFDPETPAVEINAGEIQQVFLNIIKNAAQALADGDKSQPPRLSVRLYTDGGMAVVEFVDNGPGMSAEVQRRAFEPFFSIRATGAGTGLGLAVSYAIITKNHQGFIDLSSRPGEGARFSIRLPLHRRSV